MTYVVRRGNHNGSKYKKKEEKQMIIRVNMSNLEDTIGQVITKQINGNRHYWLLWKVEKKKEKKVENERSVSKKWCVKK